MARAKIRGRGAMSASMDGSTAPRRDVPIKRSAPTSADRERLDPAVVGAGGQPGVVGRGAGAVGEHTVDVEDDEVADARIEEGLRHRRAGGARAHQHGPHVRELAARHAAAVEHRRQTTAAVPCWSSWKTGMSRRLCSSASTQKQAGAAMSSRLMPPKPGATAATASTSASGDGGVQADGVGVSRRSA